jgi:archaellum biogenesis ATPase FlaH
MVSQKTGRVPTGIPSLDPILDGGIPPGSVILLLGDAGAGSNEFVFSSIAGLTTAGSHHVPDGGILSIPAQIRYVTITRVKDDICSEMAGSFLSVNRDAVCANIRFDDLSEAYFDNSVVPDEWYSHGDLITRLQKRADYSGILAQLAGALDAAEENSLVIIDSLTDIATQCFTEKHWKNLTSLLRGLQRMAKQRNLIVFLLLTSGILKDSQEHEIADIVDAVLLFRWEETTGARRQRVMYIDKFRGVMPGLEERDLVKFAIRISTSAGFEISNIRVVI